jgi:hypothetical protein
MARPERPVEGTGPVADLARELRKVRSRAGNPGYRQLSGTAQYSKETLSAAARGEECPSWDVTKAFANACDPTGTEARRLRYLWQRADRADRRRRAPARRSAAGRDGGMALQGSAVTDGPPQPDPEGIAAEYVYQLRALRAWAGNPGRMETRQRLGQYLPSSTMYDAISPRRTTLPALRTVTLIVMSCLNDEDAVEEWVTAWRAISVREFTAANPRPSAEPTEGTRAPLRIVANQ